MRELQDFQRQCETFICNNFCLSTTIIYLIFSAIIWEMYPKLYSSKYLTSQNIPKRRTSTIINFVSLFSWKPFHKFPFGEQTILCRVETLPCTGKTRTSKSGIRESAPKREVSLEDGFNPTFYTRDNAPTGMLRAQVSAPRRFTKSIFKLAFL